MGVGVSFFNSRGVSLISTLIALSIMGFTILGMMSTKTIQERELKASKQSLARVTMESVAIKVVYDGAVCSCHFDPSFNDDATSLTLDTNEASPEIDIVSLRTGCDFSSDDFNLTSSNIIARANQKIDNGGGLTVQDVKVSEIVESGVTDLYYGKLTIRYKPESQIRTLKPIRLPITFFIDSMSGSAAARPIKSCWKSLDTTLNVSGCYNVDGESPTDKKQTLVGCGTVDKEYDRKVALGFGAAYIHPSATSVTPGSISGRNYRLGSTYMGHKTGRRNRNRHWGTYVGYQAGYVRPPLHQFTSEFPDHFIDFSHGNVFLGSNTGRFTRGSSTLLGSVAGQLIAPSNLYVTAVGHLAAGYRFDNLHFGDSFPSFDKWTFMTVLGTEAAMHSGHKELSLDGESVIVGYTAAKYTNAVNFFLGSQAGRCFKKIYNKGNAFIGYASGGRASEGKENVFIGSLSGGTTGISCLTDTKGEYNVAIGFKAGYESSGNNNVFVGHASGSSNGTGQNNVFMGYGAGKGGESNVSLGASAGSLAMGNKNTFIGWGAGASNEGEHNTMVGFEAGKDNIGNNNIFIGHQAGNVITLNSVSNNFVVGNGGLSAWLQGDMSLSAVAPTPLTPLVQPPPPAPMRTTSTLLVNGRPIVVASSGGLKKNIRLVRDVNKYLYLKDLLKTPLFTYQYKDKNKYPEKKRIGIISEELPRRLQLLKKGQLSNPDWPSIYGSFLASIQVLYGILETIKKDILSRLGDLKSRLLSLGNKQEKLIEDLTQLMEDQNRMKDRASKAYKKARSIKDDVFTTRMMVQKGWEESTKRPLSKKLASREMTDDK